MAFTIPQFPLTVNVWHAWLAGGKTYALPDLTPTGNLSPGRRTYFTRQLRVGPVDGVTVFAFPMELLVPKLTDIRMGDPVNSSDLVECPAASHRLYHVFYVDDVGKGFANEFRFVIMSALDQNVVFLDTTIVPPRPIP